ncbi:MAG: hypothetical protein HC919_14040 [Oscillatoriales cyanobacterium SM2_2_1]|nr:hypothetical protein [Oscillatoriales cyanobacterium SM2_2_1]
MASGTVLFGVLLTQSGFIAANVVEIKIQQDMPYRTARSILTKSGWQRPGLPNFGYRKTDQKVISECHGSVELCTAFPEIDA